jgi:subtilisin family serine protease
LSEVYQENSNEIQKEVNMTKEFPICLVIILCWSMTNGIIVAKPVIPPPQPDVSPVVCETYSNDSDKDCIDDTLYLKVARAKGYRNESATVLTSKNSQNSVEEIVNIQVFFNAPITQEQIDSFINLGGEITFIYRALAYGWTGRIEVNKINLLPTALGPTLVLIEEPPRVELNINKATKIGRVRPIWHQGFADNPLGFHGDESITIGVIDTGIDANHPDFTGRLIDWSDHTEDKHGNPIDLSGHGTHVAGIIAGTGEAGNASGEILRWTDVGGHGSSGVGIYRIDLPNEPVIFSSVPYFTNAHQPHLAQVLYCEESQTDFDITVMSLTKKLQSGQNQDILLNPGIYPGYSYYYGTYFLYNVENPVVVNSVKPYPGIGDGFSRFRGVAPGCNLAAMKVFLDSPDDPNRHGSRTQDALIDLADRRKELGLKVVNLSLSTEGKPGISETLRECVYNVVRNGIVVVKSAGNNGDEINFEQRQISDPGRAALALTVGATNDQNKLTNYSSYGFSPHLINNDSKQEGYKPDVVAPGGSGDFTLHKLYYTAPNFTLWDNSSHAIMSVDSGSSDGQAWPDMQPNDYTNKVGTSMSSAFVSGCAGLVIDALQQKRLWAGIDPNDVWDFYSVNDALLVKMVLCATATETNELREDSNDVFSPTLQRAEPGPMGYPEGKDPYEGYGIINADAAVEAVFLEYEFGSTESNTFGEEADNRRAWARSVVLHAGVTYELTLTNPSTGDFDLYLYSSEPSSTGTPQILTHSTLDGLGVSEHIIYTPIEETKALLVIKRVYGSGTFTLTSSS